MAGLRKWILMLSFLLYLISSGRLLIRAINIPQITLETPSYTDVSLYIFVALTYLVLQYILYSFSYWSSEFRLFLARRKTELFFDSIYEFIRVDAALKDKTAKVSEISKEESEGFGGTALSRDEKDLRRRAIDELEGYVGREFRRAQGTIFRSIAPLVIIDLIRIYSCLVLYAIAATYYLGN